jgi:hypothetical protein
LVPGAATNLPSGAGGFMDKIIFVKVILIIVNAIWDIIDRAIKIRNKK